MYDIIMNNTRELVIIGKLDIFSLMHAADKVWITDLTDIENYLSVWRHTHFDVTDKNNNASF